MSLSSALRLAVVTAAVGGLVAPAHAQSMMDQMVQNRCSAAMEADFAKAGVTPAPGLVTKTCQCVATQFSATHSLEAAKAICKSQAEAAQR